MAECRSKVRKIFGNKWVKFALMSIVYILWFVVWTGNLWFLLGELIIFDHYITRYLYRLFKLDKHRQRKQQNRVYREVWGWIEALLFATVVATLIHIFIFQMFVIPSSSMEKTLLVGDYLCVSKVAYGPKMPNTPIFFPFVHNTLPMSKTKKSYCESVTLPYHRLGGLREVKRNDIVVFNFPAGDTVLIENQAVTYYDVLDQYQTTYGQQRGREMLNRDYTVMARPKDRRENYVKRAVAIPDDTIQVINGQVYINSEPQIDIPGRQYIYFVRTNGSPISQAAMERIGLSRESVMYDQGSSTYTIPLTDASLQMVEKMRNVIDIQKYEAQGTYSAIFPNDSSYDWNEDNFGPLWVPKKGKTVELTLENLPLYRRIIDIYEDNKLDVRDGQIYINDVAATDYTFQLDYYFMMGDNRHNSADSRFWGFVPEDHIVGRPSFIWLSLDHDKSFPSNIRWNRMFRKAGAQ